MMTLVGLLALASLARAAESALCLLGYRPCRYHRSFPWVDEPARTHARRRG